MSIFKAYDIRGRYPEELDETMAYRMGQACAVHLEAHTLVVGRDARLHSPALEDALCRGILDAGVDVLDLGQVTTPMVYFAVEHLGTDGGIMVSASHNPGEYNGFKICREHAIPVGEAGGLKAIETLVRNSVSSLLAGDHPRGQYHEMEITEPYLSHIGASISTALTQDEPEQDPLNRLNKLSFRVAIDCGNGMTSVALRPLLERLSLTVIPLFFEPDGTFPNHEADPIKIENLAWVTDAVKTHGCDFGVAFDGDGDRAVFIDATGCPISSDLITAVLAGPLLQQNPGGLILYDLRSSRVVAQEVERLGGRAEMCRVGHSFVKAEMHKTNALFAGELSGHFYFRFSDRLVADDALAAFVNVLAIMGETTRSLADIIAPLRIYQASGEISRRVTDPQALLDDLALEHTGAPIITRLDGLYVGYDDWWFNLRPSNTEPVLRLNLEAQTHEDMVRERTRLLSRMEASGHRE